MLLRAYEKCLIWSHLTDCQNGINTKILLSISGFFCLQNKEPNENVTESNKCNYKSILNVFMLKSKNNKFY